MSQMSEVDQAIVKKIGELRREHHACTMRAVAMAIGMSPDVVRYRCAALREQGRVTWSDMPGSLRVTARRG